MSLYLRFLFMHIINSILQDLNFNIVPFDYFLLCLRRFSINLPHDVSRFVKLVIQVLLSIRTHRLSPIPQFNIVTSSSQLSRQFLSYVFQLFGALAK